VLVFAAQRTSELTRVLEHGRDGPAAGARAANLRATPRVGARRRLEIEAEVMILLAELVTVQALIDLFVASWTGPPRDMALPVDLGEILAELGSAPRPGSSIEVTLDLGADRTFVGDARQAAAVIELAIALAADRSRSSPLRLTAGRGADGGLVVQVRRHEPRPTGEAPARGPGAGSGTGALSAPTAAPAADASVRAPLLARIPPLAAALAPAARRAGFEAAVSEEQGEVTIVL
jgi:xanthine/CO dehydrogenase XdhC/CoxF family maturation factor